MDFKLNIIVLAAGLSRRMGAENKLLLPYQSKTIIETTVSNILAADIGEVVVVVGHEAEQVKTIVNKSFPNIKIIENPDYEKGMTTSIQAGIRATQNPKPKTQNPTEGYMICLSDMILIQPEEYQLLANAFSDCYKNDEKAIIQPVFEEKRGNSVIFSSFYKNAILETTDTEGCRSVVQAYKNHVHLVEMPTNHILQDVDNKDDYDKLVS